MANKENQICLFEDLPVVFSEKVILLDIDGTLVADNENLCPLNIKEKIKEIMSVNTVYLLTNSKNKNRNQMIEESCGATLLRSKYKKPSRRIIKELVDQERTFVVIGDKFLTDFIFAKRIGAKFMLVKRKLSGRERLYIKFINYIDDIFKHIYLWITKKDI